MRQLATFFLIMLLMSCNGQDTICFMGYPSEQWDSLKAVTDSLENRITNMEMEMEIQNPVLFGDTQITIFDSVGSVAMLTKIGDDFWYKIIKGQKRYNFWIVDGELEIWLGDSLDAYLFLQYKLK